MQHALQVRGTGAIQLQPFGNAQQQHGALGDHAFGIGIQRLRQIAVDGIHLGQRALACSHQLPHRGRRYRHEHHGQQPAHQAGIAFDGPTAAAAAGPCPPIPLRHMHLRHLGSLAAVRSWGFLRPGSTPVQLPSASDSRPRPRSSRKNPRTRYCPRLRKNRPAGLGLGGAAGSFRLNADGRPVITGLIVKAWVISRGRRSRQQEAAPRHHRSGSESRAPGRGAR